MDARWHGPPTRAMRLSANTTFQTPVLRRGSVLCDLDGLPAFVRLAGRSDQSGGQCVISQNFAVSEAIDRVVIDHAGRLHVGINHRGTNKRKSPPLEILAERV